MQKKKIEKIKAYITLYMAWRQNADRNWMNFNWAKKNKHAKTTSFLDENTFCSKHIWKQIER